MTRLFLATALGLAVATGAGAEMITKQSPHSVAETMDKLVAAVEGAGATVFARVDHAEGAASVEMELRPTQMLMFGNPKLGTPLMQMSQSAGLDLPLRVVVWEAEDGTVTLGYHDPADMVVAHGVPINAEIVPTMQGALDKLTGAAVAE